MYPCCLLLNPGLVIHHLILQYQKLEFYHLIEIQAPKNNINKYWVQFLLSGTDNGQHYKYGVQLCHLKLYEEKYCAYNSMNPLANFKSC